MDEVTAQERRVLARNPAVTIGSVRLRLEDGDYVAHVYDISILGIGILLRRRLEPGTWFVLEPAERSQRLSPELRVEVRHTTKREAVYLLGCRFGRYLKTDDLLALG